MSETVGDFASNPYELISKIKLEDPREVESTLPSVALFLINKALGDDWKESKDEK